MSSFARQFRPGTIRGFNLATSELSSKPAHLVRIGDFAVFRANTGTAGNEPHVYRPERIFADGYQQQGHAAAWETHTEDPGSCGRRAPGVARIAVTELRCGGVVASFAG